MLKKFRRGQVWYIRGTIRGIRVYETTGTANAERAEEYRAARETQLWDHATGKEKCKHTFGEAAVIYLSLRHPGPHFRLFTLKPIIDYFVNWPVDQIDQQAVDTYISERHSQSAPATIVRAVITPLTVILRVAARRNWCDRPNFDRPKEDKGKRVWAWLTHEEANRLVASSAPHLRPLLVFLLHTGARLGEALSLKWTEVDLDQKRVTFLNTKNGDARGVPLNKNVIDALRTLSDRQGYVFHPPGRERYAHGKGLGGSPIKRAFGSACVRAGLVTAVGTRSGPAGEQIMVYKNSVRVHDLRHTFASWLVMSGVPLRSVAELLGHRSLTMVMRYSHLSPDHLREAVNGIAGSPRDVRKRRLGAKAVQNRRARGEKIEGKA